MVLMVSAKSLTPAAPSYILRSIAGKTFKIACILLSTAHVAKHSAHRRRTHFDASALLDASIIFESYHTSRPSFSTRGQRAGAVGCVTVSATFELRKYLVARPEP